jgi:SpoIID/LytB domain protein
MRSILLTALILLLLPTPGAVAQEEAAGPIRLTAEGESYFRIDAAHQQDPGECPAFQPRNLHAAYRGTLEIGRRAGGLLYLVAEMDFPTYLSGIAEVPAMWPLEALKAQVVAARTYAVSHMNPSGALAREIPHDLCATDACQVYRGRNISHGAWGERWVRAVTETAGEILEHRGRPAETFYFSTSNGRTYSNTEIWGGDPRPYLRGVAEEHDGESPVRRWTVRVPLDDLARVLRRAGVWGPEAIASVRMAAGSVDVSGGGRSATMSVTALRFYLNSEAPCLVPKRYPTASGTGRTLPQPVPSRWYRLRQERASIVIEGEGWGHGVGMVQWGLYGKAGSGWSYDDMLAYYYSGLRPVKQEAPGRIRVLLASDLTAIDVEPVGPEGDFEVAGARMPDGPFRVTPGSSRMSISPTAPIPSLLEISAVSAEPGEGRVRFNLELSSEARVHLRYESRSSGEGRGPETPLRSGPQTYVWETAGLTPGPHTVRLIAEDGVDRVVSAPITVEVTGRPGRAPEPPNDEQEERAQPESAGLPLQVPVAAAVLLALALLALALLRRHQRAQ